MGRKASYRRNNVKEAAKDENAAKNVETVKEKVEAVKEKAEAAVEAVKENVKAEAVKAETAVTLKKKLNSQSQEEADLKNQRLLQKRQQQRQKLRSRNQLADLKRALKQRKNLLFSLRVNQLIRQQLLSV